MNFELWTNYLVSINWNKLTVMSTLQTSTREEQLLGSIRNALETKKYAVSEVPPYMYHVNLCSELNNHDNLDVPLPLDS